VVEVPAKRLKVIPGIILEQRILDPDVVLEKTMNECLESRCRGELGITKWADCRYNGVSCVWRFRAVEGVRRRLLDNHSFVSSRVFIHRLLRP
jgi:hypothetical protein